MMYDLRIAVLAGINKGEYAKQETKQKEYFSRKNKTKQLSTAEKMALVLDNEKSILENTVETLLDVTPNVSVVGEQDFLKENISNKTSYSMIPQTGTSLLDSIEQAITNLYANGFQGDGLIICADIPAIQKEDITSFVYNAKQEHKDIVMGLSDLAEIKELGSPNKFGIRVYDDKELFGKKNPKLIYGNIFLTNQKIYERLDDIKESLGSVLGLKKLFREPENYPKILEFLNDSGKEITAKPKTKAGLVFNSFKYSHLITRLFFLNYLGHARSKHSVTLTEMEKIAEEKILSSKLGFGFSYASPRLGLDVDDVKDATVINNLIKKK